MSLSLPLAATLGVEITALGGVEEVDEAAEEMVEEGADVEEAWGDDMD